MKSLEQLKREIARREAEREVRRDFLKRNIEQKELGKKLFYMKHPNLTISKDVLKSGIKNVATGLYKATKKMNKPSKRKRGFGFNLNYNPLK